MRPGKSVVDESLILTLREIERQKQLKKAKTPRENSKRKMIDCEKIKKENRQEESKRLLKLERKG